MQNKIEEFVKADPSLNIQIKALKVKSIYPVKVQISESSFEIINENMSTKIDGNIELLLEVDWLNSLRSFKFIALGSIHSRELNILQKLKKNSDVKNNNIKLKKNFEKSRFKVLDRLFDVSLKTEIAQSKLEIDFLESDGTKKIILKSLFLKSYNPELISGNESGKTELSFNLTYISSSINYRIPVSFSSDSISLNQKQLSISNSKIESEGLEVLINGKSDFISMSHQWKVDVNVPNISKLKTPEQLNIYGDFKGSLKSANTISYVDDHLNIWSKGYLDGVAGRLKLNFNEVLSDGPFYSDAVWDVNFINKSWSVKKLHAKIDGSGSDIIWGNYFQKRKKERLRLELLLKANNDQIDISNTKFEMANFIVKLNGSLGISKSVNSKIKLEIPPLELKGMEIFFPFLNGNPLQGKIQVKADLTGNVYNRENIILSIDPFKVENVKSTLDIQDKDKGFYFKGPFMLNGLTKVKMIGNKIEDAQFILDGNFSRTEMMFNEIKKEKNEKFLINIIGEKNDNKIILRQSNLITPFGSSSSQGRLSLSKNISWFLQNKFSNINLSYLKNKFYQNNDFKLQNSFLSGTLQSNGEWDPEKGIENSHIVNSGNLRVVTNNFNMRMISSNEKNKIENIDQRKVESSILPNWPIFKNSKFEIQNDINHFEFQILSSETNKPKVIVANNIKSLIDFKGGLTRVNFKVGELLRGRINNVKIECNLLNKDLNFKSEFNAEKISLSELEKFISTNDNASGEIGINGNVKNIDLNQLKPWESLNGNIDLKINDFRYKTIDIDQKVNQFLVKLEKMGLTKSEDKINSGGVKAYAAANLNFQNKMININSANILTPEENEMNFKGHSDWNFNGELKGSVFVKNSHLKDSFTQSNLDSKGRLILPIVIEGDLMSPKITILSQTLEQMGSNYLKSKIENEKAKAISKAEEKINEQLKSEEKKIKKDINTKIKNLFKKEK